MKTLLLGMAMALVAPGCQVESNGHLHWHTVVEVAIPAGHVHDLFCGHCFFEGRWYYQRDHVHGTECGHVFREGFWAFEKDPRE